MTLILKGPAGVLDQVRYLSVPLLSSLFHFEAICKDCGENHVFHCTSPAYGSSSEYRVWTAQCPNDPILKELIESMTRPLK